MENFVKIVDGHLQVIYENKKLKKGVSGLMRVRDDAEFVGASIDSCIDALDELIIVYNDCTDDTPNIIRQKEKQYPDKIRVYEYPYKVYAINLTKEEYNYITNEPLDSPHRLCNYYNFALSKVKYQHAMKIDADQIYFTEKLKYWCDLCSQKKVYSLSFKVLLGIPITLWIACNIRNWKNNKSNRFISIVNFSFFKKLYKETISYLVSHKDICVSLSGLNLVSINSNWYVPLGLYENTIHLLPPFNGTGDHLIFKVGKNSYYKPAGKEMNDSYQKQRSDNFTSIEVFNKDAPQLFVGTSWFHFSCMRNSVLPKILKIFKSQPNHFISLYDFNNFMHYDNIVERLDPKMVPSFELFQFLICYKDVNYINLIEGTKNKLNIIL